MVYRKIFVYGRVQGVFFRESTRQVAKELALDGFVRNRSDGRVEVLVSGDVEIVDSLIKWLKTGPKLAKVSNIEVIELDSEAWPCHEDNGFSVWPTE